MASTVRTLTDVERSITAGIAQANPLSRSDKLMEARALIRSAGIESDERLFQALTNLRAACKFESHFTQLLDDLLCGLDDLLNPPDESVANLFPRSYGELELDAQTKNVRNRA